MVTICTEQFVLAWMEQCGFQEDLIGWHLFEVKKRQKQFQIGIYHEFVGAAPIKPGSFDAVDVVCQQGDVLLSKRVE